MLPTEQSENTLPTAHAHEFQKRMIDALRNHREMGNYTDPNGTHHTHWKEGKKKGGSNQGGASIGGAAGG